MSIPQQPLHSVPGYRNSTFDSFNVAAERQTGRYGDKPFITWYDDHRDERIELSYKTFGNWVAKTANLLVDELGARPGARAGVLADHWQAPVLVAGCWRAGVCVVDLESGGPGPSGGRQAPSRTPPDLVAAFVHEQRLDDIAIPPNTPVLALAADPLGRPGRDLGRAQNFSGLVPSMGDVFDAAADPPGDALIAGGESATMDDLLARTAALAARTGLGTDDRLLSGRRLLSAGGVVAGLLAPLACGAGVVLVHGLDPARFWKRVADERVSVAVVDPGQAAAVLDAGPATGSRLRVLVDD
jgi:uncharacterized protein (TIGR03089 family)